MQIYCISAHFPNMIDFLFFKEVNNVKIRSILHQKICGFMLLSPCSPPAHTLPIGRNHGVIMELPQRYLKVTSKLPTSAYRLAIALV